VKEVPGSVFDEQRIRSFLGILEWCHMFHVYRRGKKTEWELVDTVLKSEISALQTSAL
jgi:hypothetical protein